MNILPCFLLMILIPYAASISFNLTNISPSYKDMFILEGGAYISKDAIQVTPENKTGQITGRVTYTKPLHLWDMGSNELASFSTSFSFVKLLDLDRNHVEDDGFIFFLAQNSTVIHGATGPGYDTTAGDASADRFVWVEFDPICNGWEEDTTTYCDHVGININSHSSINQTRWFNDNSSVRESNVSIKYDSGSKNLSVFFTGIRNNNVQQHVLTYTVDLRDVLPERVFLGFSAATWGMFHQNTVKSWIFNSSTLQVDENKGLPANKLGLVVGLTTGITVLVVLLVMLALVSRRKKKNRSDDEVEELGFSVEMNDELEMGATGPRRFSYLELASATAGFADKEKIGEGSFGGVYKGFLKDLSTYVAVKRMSKTSQQGVKEYASEVKIISRLRHRNLVQLIGWCHKNPELLLVYEYMENGSLDSHLFNAKSLLTWVTRYKIVVGLASALLYLHEEWEQCVLHRDIKSSNVMLDSNFNVKLGDFGLAKLVDHEKGSHTTLLAGTLGYMAPECVMTGKASKETDVFSFGVVALEITCGRKSIDYKTQKRIWLVEWVWELYGAGILLEAVDPRLQLDFDVEEVKRLMIVGLWCVHPDSEIRPSMRQVIQVLNSEASLPLLPLKMPVASYFATSMPLSFDGSNVDLSTSSSYLSGR